MKKSVVSISCSFTTCEKRQDKCSHPYRIWGFKSELDTFILDEGYKQYFKNNKEEKRG